MRPGPAPRTTRWIAVRIGALGALLTLGAAAVAGRAFQLQVLRRDALVDEMVDQYRRQLVLRPRRGVITDRSGVLLAGSADASSVFADPTVLAKDARAADALRKIVSTLKLEPGAVKRRLAKSARFAWIARRVSPADAAAVEGILKTTRVRGIALVPETKRYYPKLELASQVLGIVGEDGEGLEGIELAFDEDLRGEPAKVPSLRDGAGKMVLGEAPPAGVTREGARIELTLDQSVQLAAERALGAAVKSSRALSGVAIVLDPRTGEVLAMTSAPIANPNAPRKVEELRNRAVVDAWEPGSTVKTFTISGALESRALRPLDAIDCEKGRYAVGAHVIHDHEPLGWVGPSKVLAYSSNIGAAKIGAKLGAERLHETMLAFGLGERTEIGLPGEQKGQVPFPRSEISLATQSFGHGLTATPLQIVTGMAAIANGGELLRPSIIRRVIDPATGEVLDEASREVIRRAVSPETAALMTKWLIGVVEDPKGTGKRARLDGWRVAGKTGTARKVDPISGGYASDRHFSSFVGFAPAEAPRVVVGVFLDEPKGDVHGGEVAAPAFRAIVADAMKTLGVPAAPGVQTAPAPPLDYAAATRPLRSGRTDEAEDELEGPPPVELGARTAPRPPGEGVAVPSLAGLPARAAVRALERLDLAAELDGSGRVVGQWPAAGRVVETGTRVRMRLAPAG